MAALLERLGRDGAQVRTIDSLDDVDRDEDLVVAHVVGRAEPSLPILQAELARKVVLFIEQPAEVDLVALAGMPALAALVVKRGVLGLDEMALAVDKVLARDAAGFDRYLPEAGVTRHANLLSSTARGEMLDELERFVAALGLDGRRVAQVATIADELITNAFYHAPVDGIGGHPYTHISRIDPVPCRPDHPVELAYASSATRVAVRVRDTYGSLPPMSILRHLARAIAEPTASFKVALGSGGARLGLVTAFRAASQLIFNVVPSQYTECIGIIEIGGSYRQFLEDGKALHVFSFPTR